MSYKNHVLPIVKEVRDILLSHYGNVKDVRHKSASAVDVVTDLDVEVENFLREKLARIYPEVGFVGEETGGDRDANRFWLVDPIDATAHFVRGLPFCTTMIALIEGNEVIFSAIYDFVADIMYHAEKGGGAFANDVKLSVNDRPLSESYIAWETHIEKPENRRMLNTLLDHTIPFKTVSAGWEFAMIASGKLNARVMFDPWGKDYDFAPGSLLVREAGGIVANLGSDTYDFRNTDFIAANPKVYAALKEIFAGYQHPKE